jgi:hypothetical protein
MKGVIAMRTLAVVLALATSPLLFAQEDPKIQDAIRSLGADSFEDRERATADLKKIGAPALDALKKAAAESQDPEVQARDKKLIQEIEKPAPQKRPAGRQPGLFGSRVSIRRSGDTTVYQLQPAEGDAIEFHRGPDAKVKLVYPDGKGGKAEAEAESIEKFVETHKELADKYGVTKDGIDYGGSRMSFTAQLAFPAIPRILEIPAVPMPPELPEFKDLFTQSEELRQAFEELRKQSLAPQMWRGFGSSVIRGAELRPVPDVLRAHLSIPEGQGVVVESVYEGSTAATAGLKKHDILLEIDGRKISQPGDVRALLKRDSKVRALRSGKEIDLQPAPPPKKDY